MGFFDRFKKKKETPPAEPPAPPAEDSRAKEPEAPPVSPEADTTATLLLRRDAGWDAVVKVLESRFGPQSVGGTDGSKPNAPAVTVTLDGVEFWCSYLAMPHPVQICDFSQVEDGLYTPEEKEEIVENQAFLVLAQKNGGGDLASKRQVCRLFTRLAGALMELEEAAGLYIASPGLLVSRRNYLRHAGLLEENWGDPAYFPAPLWLCIHRREKGEHVLTGTWGLRQFGLPELWFLDGEADWTELYQRLYVLSIRQITEQDFYKDMDTIEFTPGKTSLFRELKGALFIKEVD